MLNRLSNTLHFFFPVRGYIARADAGRPLLCNNGRSWPRWSICAEFQQSPSISPIFPRMKTNYLCLPAICFAVVHAFGTEPSPLTVPLAAEKPLYLSTAAPLDVRVADLVSRMTLEEKAIALDHNGPASNVSGCAPISGTSACTASGGPSRRRCFPSPSPWRRRGTRHLVHEVAVAISDEARAIYNGWHQDPNFKGEHKGLIYRSPVINISRNPYWGRIQECYGEDPFLTGRMGVAYVKGMQGDDPQYLKLAATLKHFAVNNVEKDRQKLDARVPERMLYEYWLPHWREAVIEGGAQSVMASYNAINGTPNNVNHWLLTDLLKDEWHHDGFVVSDLGGVQRW